MKAEAEPINSAYKFKDGMVRNSARMPTQKWNEHKELLCSLYHEKTVPEILEYMRIKHSFDVNAGQLGRKLREWGMYKYDSKHCPPDLEKALSDDLSGSETLPVASPEDNGVGPAVAYSLAIPAIGSPSTASSSQLSDVGCEHNSQETALAKNAQAYQERTYGLDGNQPSSCGAVGQFREADDDRTCHEPSIDAATSVALDQSSNIPPEDGQLPDIDMDRISVVSLASSSISGFASLRSLAKRIRVGQTLKSASDSLNMDDVPSSAMEGDVSSISNHRLFGRFSTSSLSIASSATTNTDGKGWKLELSAAIREGSDESRKVYGPIPMSVYDPCFLRHKDRWALCYGLVDPVSPMNFVSENFLEEVEYNNDFRVTDMGMYWVGGKKIQAVGEVTFRWHMNDTLNQVHKTLFTVISREIPVNFAFLLGRPWCDEAGALDNIAMSIRLLT